MPQITGEDEETATGGREEDLLPGEMYLPQDMEAPLDALTAEKKDTMHATAPRRNSYPSPTIPLPPAKSETQNISRCSHQQSIH